MINRTCETFKWSTQVFVTEALSGSVKRGDNRSGSHDERRDTCTWG